MAVKQLFCIIVKSREFLLRDIFLCPSSPIAVSSSPGIALCTDAATVSSRGWEDIKRPEGFFVKSISALPRVTLQKTNLLMLLALRSLNFRHLCLYSFMV